MIRFTDVGFSYANLSSSAIHNINLEIDDGECVLITGPSGCGKSTLCRCLNGLIPHFYGGRINGSVQVQDVDVFHSSTKDLATSVGMVFQDPENQLVKSQVDSEVAFALEHQGMKPALMQKRVEEALDIVGIDHLRRRNVSTLSGGEKQKVAIASVLVMHPEVLVLDEPTSELDPKSAEDVLQVVKRLNEELGLTILLVEHRIDRVLPFVDRVLSMDAGEIEFDGTPRQWIQQNAETQVSRIPPVSQLGLLLLQQDAQIPLTIKEARTTLLPVLKKRKLKIEKTLEKKGKKKNKALVDVRKCWYHYPDGPYGVQNLSLTIHPGEFISIIGRNASGKTTVAKLLTGLLKPTKGHIFIDGADVTKIPPDQLAGTTGLVFQDPNMHLFADTVDEEISFMMQNLQWDEKKIQDSLETMSTLFDLTAYKQQFPRMLSSGEKQRVALASVLAAQPKLLILDEPTRGLDATLKHQLMSFLMDYQQAGGTILLISHDIELIAAYGQRVLLMSEGKIIADGEKHEVLSNSLHFSPQINRLIQPLVKDGWPDNLLTVQEVMNLWK